MAKRTTKLAPREPRKPARAQAAKKPAVRKRKASRTRFAGQIEPLDLSAFPPESVVTIEKWLCLACVSDVFMRHLDFSPRTAYLEIKRYTPSLAELHAPVQTRPWFSNQPSQKACPYCGLPAKWPARLWIYRIESGKATDALRRNLIKSLSQDDHQFAIVEEKATQQEGFSSGWRRSARVSISTIPPGFAKSRCNF